MCAVIVLLTIIGVYVGSYVLYSVCLVAAAMLIKDVVKVSPRRESRFGIIVPAHNEELLLPRLLKSITAQNYPQDKFKSIIVADNCTDNTPKVAREYGAYVLVRQDDVHQGKGYALRYALDQIDLSEFDAILVVDADSVLNSHALSELDRSLSGGARIIQCYNGVANPEASWFTRLLDVSRTFGNEIYHPAKQKLGLSSYLMGNGMCFASEVLKEHGWDAFTVGEDWEYYATLMQRGEIVAFDRDARVYHEESTTLKQASPQRMRWSSGRFAIAWNHGLTLFYKGLAERNIRKVDGSVPLLFPNPSLGVNLTAIGLILSFWITEAIPQAIFIVLFLTLAAMQLGMFLIGVAYTREGFKNSLCVIMVPMFLLWKMSIDCLAATTGVGASKWRRTDRDT